MLFQVEYMFYSRTEHPESRITKDKEESYLNKGYVKIEDSAMCAVRKLITTFANFINHIVELMF